MSEVERSFFVGAVLNPPKPGPILTFSQTVSACNRCRKRKAKCDTRLPACLPCQNSGSKCEYTEARTKTTFPRDYICDLEIEAGNLEHKLRQLQSAAKSTRSHDNDTSPRDLDTPTSSSRGNDEAQAQADLIRLESGGDAHYLGVSSGIHLARSVLESARRNNPSFDALPERRRPGSTTSPSQQNEHAATSSSRAAFPSCEAAVNLVEIFFNQYQVQYPILVEDQFIQETQIFYSTGCLAGTSHNDITMRFMLQVIFAIALLSLSKENPEALILAESFNTNAMAELAAVMQHKGPRTLQCLLLLLLYSLLNSSTAPIWYISGIAIRMVIDLGFQSERTIHLSGTGIANEDEVDLKRRLFWATYTFDRTLSIILGRPFTLEDREVDVEYPGRSLPLNKRASIIHWIKLQRLQSRSVSYLYTVKPGHEHTVEHQQSVSAWIRDMAKSLATWKDEATALADTNIHTVDWWHYWYQNALLVLHRPSPNNPTLDPEAFSTCYTAAKNMIQSSFIRVHKGLMDFSWVDLHYQFMGGITLLFLIWNSPDIRQQARSDWTSFKSCLVQWEVVLEGMVVRWDRVNRAKEVLGKLADATVDIVERDMTKSSNLRGSREASRLTQDRDHRKSIMQQLGSPRLQNAAPAQVAQPVDAEITAINMMASMPQAAAPSDTADQSHAFFNPSATQGPSFEPSPGEVLEMDQTSDSPFWALETSPFTLPPDLSAMFNDEMWTSFGPYENTMMPGNFGRFEYFPVPVPGADVNFGAPATGDNGTRNAAWADSVLNFHGPWDDGGQDT